MTSSPFSKSSLVLLFACAVSLFALSVLLSVSPPDPVKTGNKTRANTYSVSAIGYAGSYDLLRRMGVPVSRALDNPLSLLKGRGVLIEAEPDIWRTPEELEQALEAAPVTLLVLPKWEGRQDKNRSAWISKAIPQDTEMARQTLSLVASRGEIVRVNWPTGWSFNTFTASPTGEGVVQLMRSPRLRPLVGTEQGMLLGELTAGRKNGERAHRVWVLSDPDVISNHGLGKGENARFLLELITTLQGGDSKLPVVFDETVHGFHMQSGSPLQLLFRFPFVVVTILLFAAGGLALLAGAGRFGVAAPVPRDIDFGKEQLIENGVRLLDYAGHHGDVLKRYARMMIRSTATALHAPSGLDDRALAAWLDRVGKSRGVETSCLAILQDIEDLKPDDSRSARRLFAVAGDMHRWKGEILHGSATIHQRSGHQH